MSKKLSKPLLNKSKKKTLQEVESERKEKEDRFREIAYNQSPQDIALRRKATTPNPETIQMKSQIRRPQSLLSPLPRSPVPRSPKVELVQQQSQFQQEQPIPFMQTPGQPRAEQNPYSMNERDPQDHEDNHPNLYIDPHPQVGFNPFFFGEGVANPVMQVRRNMAVSIADAVNESICINAVLMMVSIGKIIAYFTVLVGEEISCKQSLSVWLFGMFIHDVLVIKKQRLYIFGMCTYFSKLFEVLNIERILMPEEDLYKYLEIEMIMIKVSDIWITNSSTKQMNGKCRDKSMPSLFKREQVAATIQLTFCSNYYIFLFIVGNYVVLCDTECGFQSPIHFNLAVTYVILGFAYLGVPIILFSSLCLCLPFVLLMYVIVKTLEKCNHKINIKELIEQLEKYKYNSITNQDCKDCCICMVDYKDGDDVTVLPCNRLHHFHEECVKKWLQINGVCPICRRPLEDSIRQMEMQNYG